MKYGFIIDNRKCIGCHACTTACKSEHEVPVGVFRTWVKQVEKGEFPNTRRLFSVMRCNHCTDAPCVEICPVEALYIRPDGIVDFDKNRCIGCKSCMQACPYDALYIDPDTRTAAKCNYCAQRVEIGLEPACVNVCPEHAIISGDMENPDSEISQLLARETVTVRKPEKGTQPNLYYIDGDFASLNPIATEKTNDTMWSEQSRGVGHFAKETERLAFSGDSLVMAALAANGNSVAAGDLLKSGPQKSVDVLMGNSPSGAGGGEPRRVYDAPDKGLLWGWEVSAYIWTKAIATGAFLVPLLGMFIIGTYIEETNVWETFGMFFLGIMIALIFMVATTVLLVKDLDQPKRFIYVLLRPQWKSWLVRGGYALSIFTASLALLIVSQLLNWEVTLMPCFVLAVLSSILTSVYTAFLFAQAKGRDFWQSPLLAFHMLVHSFLAGGAVFAILAFFGTPSSGWTTYLASLMTACISLNLLIMLAELATPHPTDDAKLTAEMITKGRYSKLFWWGVIVAGNLVPAAAIWSGQSWGLPLAGVLALAGIYFNEKIWVEAPQRIPLS